ncbi:MAG: Gfo/Idh/MocA family oxidoreductase [Lachnospiraceae bacterium]|nr:Gfo/Idh/MocA family oxidoreductase [Lachnospiraceae bacterium]
MKKVCIVGYGAIGPVHAKALEEVKSAQLYAICDIKAEKRALCKAQYDVLEYEDFDAMLQNTDIDTVHICTPHYLHFEMIKKALEAGKDVVVEKPVTITREEFRALQELPGAERVCVVLQNRLNPCVQKMKEIVESGELGEVKAARAMLTWKRDRSYYERDAWRGKWATEGGGLLINQAIHTLDYFCYLIGEVKSVQAHMFNYSLQDVIEVEDTLTAYLGFEHDIEGVFFATNAYVSNSTPFFELSFEQGLVRYTDKKLWINGEVAAQDENAITGKPYWGNSHVALLKRYYDEHNYFTVEDAKNTMETVFSMYESALGTNMLEIEGRKR